MEHNSQKSCGALRYEFSGAKTDILIRVGYKSFGLDLRAGVQALPVMSAEHAKKMSVIANDGTAVSNASKAEHAEIGLFRDFATKYNTVAEIKKDPSRLVTTKSSLSDPVWATSSRDVWPLQQIFGSLMAASTRLNNAGEKIDANKLKWGIQACRDRFFPGTLGRSTTEVEHMGQKMGLLLTVFSKLKSRDYELSPASLSTYKEKMGQMTMASGDIINAALGKETGGEKEQKFTSFGAQTLRAAALIYCQADPVSLTQEERIYAIGKAAMAFQAKLDETWKKLTVGGKDGGGSLPNLFRTKATFCNWMILGTLQCQGEIASPAALENIDLAYLNLTDLLKAGGLDIKASHNAARQALTNAMDLASEKGSNPLMDNVVDEKQLRLLLDAFPHSASGTVDLKAVADGSQSALSKLKKRACAALAKKLF